jgi:hypothetical protein
MGCLLAARVQVRMLLACLQGDAVLTREGMLVQKVRWCAHATAGHCMK